MKVVVDKDRCVGHGICEMKSPDVFVVGDDGMAHAAFEEIPEDHHETVAEAVASCPSQALRITD